MTSWLDMSVFPDTDPDTVLTTDQAALVHGALSAPQAALGDGAWRAMLDVVWTTPDVVDPPGTADDDGAVPDDGPDPQPDHDDDPWAADWDDNGHLHAAADHDPFDDPTDPDDGDPGWIDA